MPAQDDFVNEAADSRMKCVQDLEKWYSAEFERRMARVAEALNAELQSKVREVQIQYGERYQALKQKFENSRGRNFGIPNKDLLEEIARTKAEADTCAAELERSVSDDGVVLGHLLKIRTKELEVKAYLRGLNYRATALNPNESR